MCALSSKFHGVHVSRKHVCIHRCPRLCRYVSTRFCLRYFEDIKRIWISIMKIYTDTPKLWGSFVFRTIVPVLHMQQPSREHRLHNVVQIIPQLTIFRTWTNSGMRLTGNYRIELCSCRLRDTKDGSVFIIFLRQIESVSGACELNCANIAIDRWEIFLGL